MKEEGLHAPRCVAMHDEDFQEPRAAARGCGSVTWGGGAAALGLASRSSESDTRDAVDRRSDDHGIQNANGVWVHEADAAIPSGGRSGTRGAVGSNAAMGRPIRTATATIDSTRALTQGPCRGGRGGGFAPGHQ